MARPLAAATDRFPWADESEAESVVTTDPKGRFEREGERVRVAYGHSVAGDLKPTDAPVSDELYHGTEPGSVEAIERPAGRRHAPNPAVFVVDVAALLDDCRKWTSRRCWMTVGSRSVGARRTPWIGSSRRL